MSETKFGGYEIPSTKLREIKEQKLKQINEQITKIETKEEKMGRGKKTKMLFLGALYLLPIIIARNIKPPTTEELHLLKKTTIESGQAKTGNLGYSSFLREKLPTSRLSIVTSTSVKDGEEQKEMYEITLSDDLLQEIFNQKDNLADINWDEILAGLNGKVIYDNQETLTESIEIDGILYTVEKENPKIVPLPESQIQMNEKLIKVLILFVGYTGLIIFSFLFYKAREEQKDRLIYEKKELLKQRESLKKELNSKKILIK